MKRIIGLLMLLLVGGIRTATAASLTFHGRLMMDVPFCTVNDGNTLEVSFGTIVSDKIDGVNYLTDIPWTFYCTETRSPDIAVYTLQYEGTSTNFSPDAITTSIDGLGIVLQQNGEIFRPGDTLTNNYPYTKPTLKAVPIKQPGKDLTEGYFEAYAVLIMGVQ
ncbi:TPA: fimbrial protein [Salmonella enterica subsp. enterica serovar Enteritidis]|nr:putative fimbrial subunit SteE [Salmonella enterica subsp. enterica serovar Enteritidis str. SARB17]HAE4693907.1 fimbrial protein [Salmonella enterica subsp. enterica serovar Enteritidis]HAU6870853.1 fimbrial protein [Salmonella enterica subsp. enterica serovar Enteritidis]